MTDPHPMTGRTGSDHPRWSHELDQQGALRRLSRQRGRASDQQCTHCDRRALHWVLTRHTESRRSSRGQTWSLDAADYDPMCRRHRNEFCPNLETMRQLGIIHTR